MSVDQPLSVDVQTQLPWGRNAMWKRVVMHCPYRSNALLAAFADATLALLWAPPISVMFGAITAYIIVKRRRCSRVRICAEQILKSGFGGIRCTPGRLGTYWVSHSVWVCNLRNLKWETAFEPQGGRPLFSYPWPIYSKIVDVDACRVEDGPCRGLVFALADVRYSLKGSVQAASEWGDWARAELEPAGPSLVKVKMECNIVRARGARLILEVP